ncbi:MAG TPA: RNA methyltransferase substrate-binding domain-containing protein, partial [Candidatus Binataceae bacterium]|nr:RNA methyltransferase substrate-binding domain-containing protein [Candidatus Binataceae bacterium]
MKKPPHRPHRAPGPQPPHNPGPRTEAPHGSDTRADGDRNRYRGRRRRPRPGGPARTPEVHAPDERRPHPPDNPAGRDLIFGVEPVRELLAAAPGAIRVLYVKAAAQARFASEIDAARIQGANVFATEDDALARMAGSEARHQGLVAIMREYEYVPFEEIVAEAHDPLLVIDGVTDPRNLGAIMR